MNLRHVFEVQFAVTADVSGKVSSIGPRTIQCLLHRYQFARELLRTMGEPIDPHQLAVAIADCYMQNRRENTEGSVIERIALQVS